jgi:outer membrane protein OmpA-like peptidoglycan-associated protein
VASNNSGHVDACIGGRSWHPETPIKHTEINPNMANSNPNGDRKMPDDLSRSATTKKKGWLPWVLLALGIIALLFGIKRCSHTDDAAGVTTDAASVTPAATVTAPAPAIAPDAGVAVLVGTSTVGSYLAGTGALPHTFVFEKLNFDTAQSSIRGADRAELDDLAAAMKQHPNARIRIVGYADARGDAAANATLGKARADSVKAALVADGIDAARLETASGGETNPVDTNATANGRAENRRTELIVLQR